MLSELIQYWRTNRRRGHTNLTFEGLDNYKGRCFVVAANRVHWLELKKRVNNPYVEVITVDDLDQLRGHTAALVVDHYAIEVMYRQEINRYETLEVAAIHLIAEYAQIPITDAAQLLREAIHKLRPRYV